MSTWDRAANFPRLMTRAEQISGERIEDYRWLCPACATEEVADECELCPECALAKAEYEEER